MWPSLIVEGSFGIPRVKANHRTNIQLGFEPQYHRRIAQTKFVLLPMFRRAQLNGRTRDAVKMEYEALCRAGFSVVEKDMDRPFKKFEADKGDVAAVIAGTNPQFNIVPLE
ncbi:MAG: hypothetical protein C9356_20210 [Oleiphilus sp.]|nr:MAG: hypothetical protein C9356_20210 [Oleiphilus sp.]